jgi:tetrahydromethanopterin S-methyltransferase subunit B
MPEFTRDELDKLHTLLAELIDALERGPNYLPSSAPSKKGVIDEASKLQNKIMGLLYPP